MNRSWRRSRLVSISAWTRPRKRKRRNRRLKVLSKVPPPISPVPEQLLIDQSFADLDAELKHSRALLFEYDEHVKALENGEEFVPRLTAKNAPKKREVKGKKRKNSSGGKKGSPKRRKNEEVEKEAEEDEETEFGVDSDSDLDSVSELDSESDSDSDSDSGSSASDSDEEGGYKSGSAHGSESASDADGEDDSDAGQEEGETIDNLKAKMEVVKVAIKDSRGRLTEVKKDKKDAADALSTLKEDQVKAQREKNAFCSLKRSEVRIQ
jgi:hypothetical protein